MNANFSECKFSSDMVSYMYGELSSEESPIFEQHLIECSTCTDEFAAISSSRYEVYDWKKLEFDPLETPRFEIPLGEVASVSWSEKIRAVFARGWAIPTVSFAAVAIVSVVIAGLIWRQGDSGVVALKTTEPATVTAQAEDEVPAPVPGNSPTGNIDNKLTPPVVPSTTQAAPPKRPAAKSSDSQPVRAMQKRSVEVKQTTARTVQKSVPTLNGYPDDEDTSLRLAELLDDIGSR